MYRVVLYCVVLRCIGFREHIYNIPLVLLIRSHFGSNFLPSMTDADRTSISNLRQLLDQLAATSAQLTDAETRTSAILAGVIQEHTHDKSNTKDVLHMYIDL